MPGACCTRGLVCQVHIENAHEHTGTDGALRHSLRSGLTAYAALSPATNSSCHRRRQISGLPKPGWVKKTSASLTPATGARTTRFCRTQLPLPIASASMCCQPKFWRRRLSAVRLRAVFTHGNRPANTSRARRCRVHRNPS